MSIERIIVGLGNPGDKYALNRHNIGFMGVDYISQRLNIKVNRIKFKALCGESDIEGVKVLIMKPQTFMNLSGEAVREAAEFYKIEASKILVISDDVSLEPGIMRIRRKGSDGGHNGIKNIILQLGSDQFPRIKLGAGIPPPYYNFADWVTGDIPKSDRELIYGCIEKTFDAVGLIIKGEFDKAMNMYN